MSQPLHPETLRTLGFRDDLVADLSRLGLSPEALEARRRFIGGSDATIIAKADPEDVNNLALFKRGLRPPDDLSGELMVAMGIWTEPLNLAWAEKQLRGTVTRRGERVYAEGRDFMAATLDGWWPATPAVVQAKHTNAFMKREQLLEIYAAQLHHEMFVTGAREALLSVFYGNLKYELIRVEFDALFAGEVIEAEEQFWSAVQEGREVYPVAVEAPPPPPDALIEIDLSTNNEFGDAAGDWKQHQGAAIAFEAAEKRLKELLPPNARRVHGFGLEVVRDGRGRRIRPIKE